MSPVSAGESTSLLQHAVQTAATFADAVDREARFPVESIAALREAGALGALVPRELGGLGLTVSDVASQCQQLAQACASTAMIYAMHQIKVSCLVNHVLDQPWHREFVRRIAQERLLLASITSEVGTGGDQRSSVCAVKVEDGAFTLTKHATTVSYGAYADVFLVTTRSHADAPPSDQVMVTCLREDSSLEMTSGWDALGMRGTCSAGYVFQSSGVANQVAPVPFADISADTMVPVSHLLWSAVWTGIAANALMRARAFLRAQARRQHGGPTPGAARLVHATGMLEMMQARIRVMLTSFDACNAMGSSRNVVSAEEAGWPVGVVRATALNTLKFDVSTMCHEVVLEAMLICGMAGYKNDTEFSVGRHLRDVLSAQLMISNDRIAAGAGALLLAQRTQLATL